MNSHEQHVAVAWSGLPVYAAWSIKELSNRLNGKLSVIGTKPAVPATGMEHIIGLPINWVARNTPTSWNQIGIHRPDVLFHTGWAYPEFNSLASEVRANGGAVVSLIDNRWKGSLRQLLGAIKFRVSYRRLFHAVMVPGSSGRRLCRFLGVPGNRIFEGMYGCNPEVFTPGAALDTRQKRIVFVGSLIERKGVPELLEAFRRFRTHANDWELEIYGQGPLGDTLGQLAGVVIKPFASSEVVAAAMRNARVVVLPSREDHWGVVVHEGVCSGCAVIVSTNVGAAPDFANPDGCFIFRAGDANDLCSLFQRLDKWTGEQWRSAHAGNLAKAHNFGPRVFAHQAHRILDTLT